jgi:hypothetical protein
MLLPLLVALLWGSILHVRYGVFTLGSQFKTNLLQDTLRGEIPTAHSSYSVLIDVARYTNGFATDPMPPGSWEWSYYPDRAVLIRRIAEAELRNIPRAIKEASIVSGIGILLGFLTVTFTLHKYSRHSAEWIIGTTVAFGSASLIFAYSMLVIDTRYLFPLIALWFAIGSRALWGNWGLDRRNLRAACVVLTCLSVGFSAFYRSSPFRTETRDWQVVCRETGDSLRRHRAESTVSIGSGPFPQHGVGWEAGYTSSYFGNARLLAASEFLPHDSIALKEDIGRTHADAVLVWSVDQRAQIPIQEKLHDEYPASEAIIDPQLGEVGLVLYRRPI